MERIKEMWSELDKAEKDCVKFGAGVYASLFAACVLKKACCRDKIIKIRIPKNADAVIFIKGGK